MNIMSKAYQLSQCTQLQVAWKTKRKKKECSRSKSITDGRAVKTELEIKGAGRGT